MEECICVILEIQGNEVTAHACEIDVRNHECFVDPSVFVAFGSRIAGVAKPVSLTVENRCVARIIVVNVALRHGRISTLFVSETFRIVLKGFFANSRWRTTVHIGRCRRVDRGFDVEVNRRVSVVVGVHTDIIDALCVQAARFEEVNGFDCWVKEIERRDICNDVIVDVLLIPSIVGHRSGEPIRGVVQ